jgi:hypothetical protein
MHNDSPDTIVMEETQWQQTHVDDVFLPTVRVQLGWKDVEAAVERGAVLPQKAHMLWAGWAAPTSGLRVGMNGVAPAYESTLVDALDDDLPEPAVAGPLQRYGLVLGLVAGVLLGAGGAMLLGG